MLITCDGHEAFQVPVGHGPVELVEDVTTGEQFFTTIRRRPAAATADLPAVVVDDDAPDLPAYMPVTDLSEVTMRRVLKAGLYEGWRIARGGILWLKRTI